LNATKPKRMVTDRRYRNAAARPTSVRTAPKGPGQVGPRGNSARFNERPNNRCAESQIWKRKHPIPHHKTERHGNHQKYCRKVGARRGAPNFFFLQHGYTRLAVAPVRVSTPPFFSARCATSLAVSKTATSGTSTGKAAGASPGENRCR
jgi:hypothetical protein